jgi:hypothetical protein
MTHRGGGGLRYKRAQPAACQNTGVSSQRNCLISFSHNKFLSRSTIQERYFEFLLSRMDPVTTTFIAVNIAALTFRIGSLYKLVRGIQDLEEPGLERIQIGLLTEFTNFKIWTHQVGLGKGGDLNNFQDELPPGAYKTAEVIIRSIGKWMSRSMIQLKSYGIDYDPGVKSKDMFTMAKRLKWRMTGYKDLDEMLKTLQALNHGLQTLCKPIIAYDDDSVERLIESVEEMVAKSNLQDGASEAQLSQVYSHSSSPSHLQNETADPLMQYTAKPFLPSSQPPALVHSVEVNALNSSAASQAAKQVAQSAQSFPTQDVFQACLSMLNAAIGSS